MKRLAALGVIGSWESGWQRAHGNERGVMAAPIGRGESVVLEAELETGEIKRLELSAQQVPLDFSFARYRIVKDASRAEETLATTVEMILSNGTAS